MLACAHRRHPLGGVRRLRQRVSLASRIDDSQPTVIVSADAGSRGGKVVPYKPPAGRGHPPGQPQAGQVLMIDRGLAPFDRVDGRDAEDYAARASTWTEGALRWVDATHPSYTLYTSGTTGKPKGVQRDTGGYAVALAASMKHIFCGNAGRDLLQPPATSAGWWATATSSTAR